MLDSKLYTKKQLKGDVWPYGDTLFNKNRHAGILPEGRLRNGVRLWTGDERMVIRQAVIENKLVKVREKI